MSEQTQKEITAGAVSWSRVEQLSCELAVTIQVAQFGVRDLLALSPGAVIDARWDQMKEVPLEVNGRQVAWCEFEVVGDRLGVRITELR